MTPTRMRAGRRGRAGRSLALVSILILSGIIGMTVSSPMAAAATPQLEILAPSDGSVFGNGTAVTVQLLVANFTLVQPGRVGQVATLNEGHVNVFLDGQYVRLVTDLQPFSLTVPSGGHTIVAELVADDGTPLTPDVSASVHIVATRGPAGGVPAIAIVSPKPLETTGHGFWLTLVISNFALVGAHGQPNAPNEGHIQLLIDEKVVEEFSTYEPIILVAMPDGDITITARLVNNDNSPLSPDVSATVPIHVTASSSVSLPLVINGGVTLLLGFTLIVLIIRRRQLGRRNAKTLRENP